MASGAVIQDNLSEPLYDATIWEKSRAGSWYALALLSIMFLCAMIDRTIMAMLISPIKSDLKLGDFQASLLMGTAFGVCYIACVLPFGWLSDRIPRRWVIALGLAIWSLACASGGFVSTFSALFVSRMLVGVGESSLSPASYSMIADLFPRRKISLAMAIFHYAGAVGSAAALMLGGLFVQMAGSTGTVALPIMGDLRGWQLALLAVGVPGIPLALLAMTLPEPREGNIVAPPSTSTLPPSAIKPFLARNKRLVSCHFVGFALILMVTYGLSFWLPSYFSRSFGWQPARVGATLALLALGGGLAGQIFSVRLIAFFTKRGREDATILAFLFVLIGAIMGALLAFLSTNPILCLAGLFLSNFSLFPVLTYGASALQLFTPPPLRGRVSGLFLMLCSLLGMGVGPALYGFVTQFILKDDARLGTSLLVMSVLVELVALVILSYALAPMRRLVKEIEGMSTQPILTGLLRASDAL